MCKHLKPSCVSSQSALVSLCRLFVEVKAETSKRRTLPLQHQQSAFKSVYLKAQEGMKLPVRPAAASCGFVAVIS